MRTIDQVAATVMGLFLLFAMSSVGGFDQMMASLNGFFGAAHSDVHLSVLHDGFGSAYAVIQSAHESLMDNVERFLMEA